MKPILYLLFLIIIYPLSFLPLSLLYIISDVLKFCLYTILGYRKEVIADNLSKAFPDKDNDEIKQITANATLS